MKHLNNFKLFETQSLLDGTGITNENKYIYDDGNIHDSLLYDHGLVSDLEAYHNIRGELRVSVNKLPEEAQTLIKEIDSFILESQPKLREKILKLYSVLTGDNSLNEGAL